MKASKGSQDAFKTALQFPIHLERWHKLYSRRGRRATKGGRKRGQEVARVEGIEQSSKLSIFIKLLEKENNGEKHHDVNGSTCQEQEL